MNKPWRFAGIHSFLRQFRTYLANPNAVSELDTITHRRLGFNKRPRHALHSTGRVNDNIKNAAVPLTRHKWHLLRHNKVARTTKCNCFYSHSIVPGGLLVTSYTTRLMPLTSFTIRLEMVFSTSCGSGTQSAVMPSSECTARMAQV